MSSVIVNNVEVQMKTWNGKRVVTFDDIELIHGRNAGVVRKNFNNHKNKFMENIDYYVTTRKEFSERYSPNSVLIGNPNIKAFLFTESGYLMIAKTLKDPEAWKVQRKLVNIYFKAKDLIEEKETSVIAPETPAQSDMIAFMEMQTKFLEAEAEKNEIFRNTMMQSFQMLASIVANHLKSEETAVIPTPVPEVKAEKSRHLPGYEKWRKDIYSLLTGHNTKEKLVRTYAYIQKHYGVCFDQTVKDFYNKYERNPESKLEAVYFLEQENPSGYKGLLKSCLYTICQNENIKINYPAKDISQVKDLVSFIAKHTDNHSPNGSAIYRKFFHECDLGVDWKAFEETYRKEFKPAKGKRVSNLMIIQAYTKLMPSCVKAFNEFVAKTYPEVIEKIGA